MENSLLPVALLRDLVMGQLFFLQAIQVCVVLKKREVD